MAAEQQGLEYFLANQEAFDKLTDEQIIALGQGESVEIGDTAPPANDGNADSGNPPTPAAAATTTPEAGTDSTLTATAAGNVETGDPVLLAKDGKHVIPYSRLTEVQEKAAQLEAALAEKDALIAGLHAAKQQDAQTGGTAAQDAVMAEYAGEFPEVAQDLKPYIQQLIDAGVTAKTAELRAQLDQALAPLQADNADRAADAHFAAIKGAHADFDQLVESNAVQDWIKTQPAFLQASMQAVYDGGTAKDVIDLFQTYKAAQPAPAAAPVQPSKQDLQAAAAQKIAGVKSKTPVSLSEFPAGVTHPVDELVAEASMNASQLLAKMQNMSPDQILKHIGRSI